MFARFNIKPVEQERFFNALASNDVKLDDYVLDIRGQGAKGHTFAGFYHDKKCAIKVIFGTNDESAKIQRAFQSDIGPKLYDTISFSLIREDDSLIQCHGIVMEQVRSILDVVIDKDMVNDLVQRCIRVQMRLADLSGNNFGVDSKGRLILLDLDTLIDDDEIDASNLSRQIYGSIEAWKLAVAEHKPKTQTQTQTQCNVM
jgi:hypothetical protein